MNIAIVLAGGNGTRVGAGVPKQFIEIEGKTILEYTLDIFQNDLEIDAIEIVCHKDWLDFTKKMCDTSKITKVKWFCDGGNTFQESTKNGIFNLKGKINQTDIAVISFGAAPLTPVEDINDSIRVAKIHGNGIASKDIDLCTCIKDNEDSSSQNLIRETLKGFANPWAFRYGELLEAYEEGEKRGILKTIEPHTTSLYFALGKKIWFSQSTSIQSKITHKEDIDVFRGYLLLQKQKRQLKELTIKNSSKN